jgi:aryl-alcohol dehydrogenase-like predicted oxidoreductase
MKIIIGTVQFGLNYGVNNQNGIPDDKELEEIFDLAKKSSIDLLDTAPAYGNAQLRIGELSQNQFNIVTKFPRINSFTELADSFNNSLKALDSEKIYGFIAHDADNLIDNPKYWNFLLALKQDEKVQKIGYSLYNPHQLNQLLEIGLKPDLIQIPYNILNRSFEEYFEILKGMGTEIHVRSVFLQGLFFMNPDRLPKKLESLSNVLRELNHISQKLKTDIATLALNFVAQNPKIDAVVLGVESTEQLQKNLSMLQSSLNFVSVTNEIKLIRVQEEELLNPANW